MTTITNDNVTTNKQVRIKFNVFDKRKDKKESKPKKASQPDK